MEQVSELERSVMQYHANPKVHKVGKWFSVFEEYDNPAKNTITENSDPEAILRMLTPKLSWSIDNNDKPKRVTVQIIQNGFRVEMLELHYVEDENEQFDTKELKDALNKIYDTSEVEANATALNVEPVDLNADPTSNAPVEEDTRPNAANENTPAMSTAGKGGSKGKSK